MEGSKIEATKKCSMHAITNKEEGKYNYQKWPTVHQ